MAGLIKAYNHLLNGLAVCAGIVIFAAFVLIVVDVTIRILGFSPPAFTIAVCEYILLYYAMFAAPWLVRKKGHVYVDAVTHLMPPLVKTLTAKFAYLVSICSALIFCYFSTDLLIDAWNSGVLDVRGIDMPQWLLYLPMPLTFLLVAIEFGRYLVGIDDYYVERTEVKEAM